ncbi:hypothetical protein B0T24DRAFT_613389 [Lasiosphaeria ovina]|uniref:Uncharacterized protein n=1 Tax=Lasiosphaeria ovina TaxID=92902 RepID=A0AAE0NE93_9PEZI|nr:hypothetical protein B0T24DRAFT_613389 [Lasiosphaeria ovina]
MVSFFLPLVFVLGSRIYQFATLSRSRCRRLMSFYFPAHFFFFSRHYIHVRSQNLVFTTLRIYQGIGVSTILFSCLSNCCFFGWKTVEKLGRGLLFLFFLVRKEMRRTGKTELGGGDDCKIIRNEKEYRRSTQREKLYYLTIMIPQSFTLYQFAAAASCLLL